jgi:hypothetical protein
MPTFSHGSVAKIYLDGMDVSPYLQEVGLSTDIDTAETSCLGTTAKTYVPGLQDGSAKMSGFLDQNLVDDTLTFSYKANSLLATQTQATFLPAGDVFGTECYMLKGLLTSSNVSASVGDVASVDMDFQNCTGLDRAVTIHALGAETATGQNTGINNTVLTSNGAHAVLHVTAVTGTSTPTVTVKLQHSVDSTNGTDGVWVDLITFGAKTAKGSEYATSSGTVNKYVRALWTITGSSPSLTFHVAFGRQA